MASINFIFPSLCSSRCCRKNQTGFPLNPSQFLGSKSLLRLKKQFLCSSIRIRLLKSPKTHASPIVCAAQSNFLRVIQTAWKVAKDGVEAGTDLVPDAIPRPIARISVSIVAASFALFVLNSFLSTALFALAVMGLSYFAFIALNKGDGPKGKGRVGEGTASGDDDSLEEARRIMDKYK